MDKAAQLQVIYQELEQDLSKLPLGNSGEPIVPGEGNPEAQIMFIGEAPGYYESVQRRPFVGKSGQFFRETFRQVGFDDQTAYISNIVKVRPPDNRDPTPAEILAYRPYLDREIETIQPKLIITLGRFSMAKFLPDVKISQVHGRLHKVKWKGHTCYILPMYHPAAALRNPQMRTSFVTDFQKIAKVLEWIKNHEDLDVLESAVKASLL